jgi:putative transcriptional regulator
MGIQHKLIELRREKGLTQDDMAKLLNLSRVGYSLKETGKNDFKHSEMNKISKFFKLEVGKIFLS